MSSEQVTVVGRNRWGSIQLLNSYKTTKFCHGFRSFRLPFSTTSVHARRCVIRSDCHRTLHGHLSSIRSSTIDQEMDCNPAPKLRWPSHWLWSASLGSCSASLTPVVWPPNSLFTCIFTTWIPTYSYAWEPSSTFRPFTSFTSFVSRSSTPYWIVNSAKHLRGNSNFDMFFLTI